MSGTANERSDYELQYGTVSFAPGETQKSFIVPIINNANGAKGEQKTIKVIMRDPYGAAFLMPNVAIVTITNNTGATSTNPIDDPSFYVTQHYLDFLNRLPDSVGLNFWKGEIASCNGDATCIDVKRQNVSAAYFLSTQFQQTGYLVYKLYKAAYGNIANTPIPVRFADFELDVQAIGNGVIVGQTGWEAKLEANKQQFATAFVNRAAFTAKYDSLTNAQYVAALNANANGALSASDVNAFVNGLNAKTETRATVLRKVAENAAFDKAEFSRAFVLMQYFG